MFTTGVKHEVEEQSLNQAVSKSCVEMIIYVPDVAAQRHKQTSCHRYQGPHTPV